MLHDLRVSADALQRVADWMLSTGAGGADVEMRRDGDVLVAEQGDDRAAWDMGGHARPDAVDAPPVASDGIYLAEMESEHFQWRAVGRSEDEARSALADVWDAHAAQIDDCDIMAGAIAVEEYGCNIHRARFGVGLRDGSEVTA